MVNVDSGQGREKYSRLGISQEQGGSSAHTQGGHYIALPSPKSFCTVRFKCKVLFPDPRGLGLTLQISALAMVKTKGVY
ncbi:hypothetical protein AOY38_01180 [Synechocystis sp. PCC 6803]|nr:hypothetical protein AOY38_01180 [Synechocystis sp. PCC 6803]AVP88420.1 hypothetical protein C7I86_01195 [Synechocystis sp. IPPAS B-1465]